MYYLMDQNIKTNREMCLFSCCSERYHRKIIETEREAKVFCRISNWLSRKEKRNAEYGLIAEMQLKQNSNFIKYEP
jgi:hypothetical protein